MKTSSRPFAEAIQKRFPGAKIFNTICDSTHRRQQEVLAFSAESGGHGCCGREGEREHSTVGKNFRRNRDSNLPRGNRKRIGSGKIFGILPCGSNCRGFYSLLVDSEVIDRQGPAKKKRAVLFPGTLGAALGGHICLPRLGGRLPDLRQRFDPGTGPKSIIDPDLIFLCFLHARH